VLLLIGGCGYVINFLVHALLPAYDGVVSTITSLPLAISELSIVFWLLIRGIKDPQPASVVS
jgi:hypothetical protein